ncbi:hypothetical protein [Aliarcobacter butzleri]|uniref:Uncharacterized protein n=1 Tax=Aliarcobacter butzleri L351 TaxID=1447259 RepID=A0A837J2F8_9BACT|nr:hypothetical protein [Aliarcobacter butzleri]KLD99477.1 hypothetical protein AF76_10435 [Aliarcobacter butzleri L351]KLE12398.1 hypothetical protein AF75_07770 [Aliarcobacter butzleri L350]
MAEFLSQDEIDALLDIAEQGDDIDGTNPLDKFTAKEKITLFMTLKNLIELHLTN